MHICACAYFINKEPKGNGVCKKFMIGKLNGRVLEGQYNDRERESSTEGVPIEHFVDSSISELQFITLQSMFSRRSQHISQNK